ncbi:uncharacterized protein LOC131691976 [Topomyia yanbarensis]|uniref:uncharacterized protein LOC131691976 n=1 Tax=Topomyia yanbarensis TaxID=2498891 RepID=UPI00273A791F|nr:uncharacterized protein LOC131691976 [Topomyia yanbarensis]
MDSPVPSTMDFSTFVLELNQSPLVDFAKNGNNSNRNCCLSDSRLSQEFEGTMQMLMSNYDLDEENNVGMLAIPVLNNDCFEPDREESGCVLNDSAFSIDRESHESLETTLDNDDDPLELTGEEFDDSGDAADGGSSDEQQHSRSLSLSYSLSISHAQENFSQYSQSTDKGLSKRYDSPCSYEDDRESECTNFDKLDDWNDIINDMQNNNNNADGTTRDFREYLASKGQTVNPTGKAGSGEERTIEENDTKELSSGSGYEDTGHTIMTIDRPHDPRPDTPAIVQQTTVTEKCRTFLEYRNPTSEIEDELMASDENWDTMISHQNSLKRKFCYEDCDDYEYEVTELITEKFRKTDIVPDHGSHEPISLIDEQQFNQLTQVESPSKTPIPGGHSPDLRNDLPTQNIERSDLVVLDGEEDCAVATTPTNSSVRQEAFHVLTDDMKLGRSTLIARKPNLKIENRRSVNGISTHEGTCRARVDSRPLTSSTAHRRSNLNLSLTPNKNAHDDSHY